MRFWLMRFIPGSTPIILDSRTESCSFLGSSEVDKVKVVLGLVFVNCVSRKKRS